MQLTVVCNGKSFTVSTCSSETIDVLLSKIQAIEPSVLKLVANGTELATKTMSLTECNVSESTLVTAYTSSSSSTKKPNSSRCHVSGCNDKVAKIIGDCRFCLNKYCARHRLPEVHMCSNLDSCRLDSYNKNAGKLLNEKCVAAKV